MANLYAAHVRFGVGDCLRDPDREKRRLPAIIERLWRESPEAVTAAYDTALFGSLEDSSPCSESAQGHGLLAERMKAARRPILSRDREGLSLTAMALKVGLDRETLAALMEKHDYVASAPYGRTQNRRLCTDTAFRAGVGHNVNPGSKRSLRLDGMAKAAPFAVFYPEHVDAISWTLNWAGIVKDVSERGGKRGRVRYALDAYGWLPNASLAGLCGCTTRGIEKARLRWKLEGKPASETQRNPEHSLNSRPNFRSDAL